MHRPALVSALACLCACGGRTFAPTHIIKCARNRFRDVFNTASGSDEVVEAHRILASAYFTHGEHKRALAHVDAILALKEK